MNEWWHGFFSGIALDLWRNVITDEQTKRDADFIERECRLSTPSSVLDVPCGNGRVAIELAARGHRSLGVDVSGEFLAEARKTAADRGLPVDFRETDMREIPRDSSFDAAFCWGNSFGYLGDEGDAAFVKALAGAVRPGGRIVLNAGLVAESFLPKYRQEAVHPAGDITLIVRHTYDPRSAILRTEYTFRRSGSEETRTGFQRMYACTEICRIVEASGFALSGLFGDHDGAPFAIGSPELFLVAERVGPAPHRARRAL